MVKVSPAQEKILVKLKNAKVAYDKQVASIDAESKVRKQELKAPIAKLIEEAQADNIPARQIAVRGLGYVDVSGLRTFLTAQPVIGTAGSIKPNSPTGTYEVTVTPRESDSDYLNVTDTFGNVFDCILTMPRGDSNVIQVTRFIGDHSDLRQMQNAVLDYLTDTYPDFDVKFEYQSGQ